MENENSSTKKDEHLTDLDFEKLRCGKCKHYLNCPPIMAFHGQDDYAECGRCFTAAAAATEGLQPIRNRSLELLASITPFPCKNSENGCTERRTWPQLEMHESECLHRTFICPLASSTSCAYKGEIENLLEHFQEKHSDLFLVNGVFNGTFDKDFEKHCLVTQNSNIFVFLIKYDVKLEKAWFLVNLLEDKVGAEYKLRFTSSSSEGCFVTKHNAVFKEMSVVDVTAALEINMMAIKSLLNESRNIQCTVSLNTRLPALHPLDLLKEIRCPVCWDYMRGRIFLCVNGHNICSNCKELSVHCPSCRDDILDIRNFSLEKLITHALFPCKYHNVGCNYIATLDELMYHLDHCSLKPSDE